MKTLVLMVLLLIGTVNAGLTKEDFKEIISDNAKDALVDQLKDMFWELIKIEDPTKLIPDAGWVGKGMKIMRDIAVKSAVNEWKKEYFKTASKERIKQLKRVIYFTINYEDTDCTKMVTDAERCKSAKNYWWPKLKSECQSKFKSVCTAAQLATTVYDLPCLGDPDPCSGSEDYFGDVGLIRMTFEDDNIGEKTLKAAFRIITWFYMHPPAKTPLLKMAVKNGKIQSTVTKLDAAKEILGLTEESTYKQNLINMITSAIKDQE